MLGRALKTLRVFHDKSQTELARQLEISTGYLSQIETGDKKNVSLELLEKYASVFNIPVSSILLFAEKAGDSLSEKTRMLVSSHALRVLEAIVREKENESGGKIGHVAQEKN